MAHVLTPRHLAPGAPRWRSPSCAARRRDARPRLHRAVGDERHAWRRRGNVQHDVGERSGRTSRDRCRSSTLTGSRRRARRRFARRPLRRVSTAHGGESPPGGRRRGGHGDAGCRVTGRAAEQGPVRRVSKAFDEDEVGRIEPDDAALMQEQPRATGDVMRPPPQAMTIGSARLMQLLHRREFDLAERRLAVTFEDLAGVRPEAVGDLVVEIDRGPAKALGQQRRDGALSGSRQSRRARSGGC